MELKNELLTQNYTKIYHEDKFRYLSLIHI